MNKNPRVAILCRVSTDGQDTSRQVSELKALCQEKGWNVVAVVENKESGMKKALVGLETVKELARRGEIQKVVVSEISRIARRLSVVSKFVEEMEELKVSVFWQNRGLETLFPNGDINPHAYEVLAIETITFYKEAQYSKSRIRSGLASARAKGKILGRPKGACKSSQRFLADHRGIFKRLERGESIREISRSEACSFGTIYKAKKILGEKGLDHLGN